MDVDILHNECSKTEKQGLVPEKPGGKTRGEGHPRKAAGALSQRSSFALVTSHPGGHGHLPGTPLSLWTSGKGTPMYAAWSSEGLAERLANWEQRWFSSSRQRTRATSQAFITSRGTVDYSQQIPEHSVSKAGVVQSPGSWNRGNPEIQVIIPAMTLNSSTPL